MSSPGVTWSLSVKVDEHRNTPGEGILDPTRTLIVTSVCTCRYLTLTRTRSRSGVGSLLDSCRRKTSGGTFFIQIERPLLFPFLCPSTFPSFPPSVPLSDRGFGSIRSQGWLWSIMIQRFIFTYKRQSVRSVLTLVFSQRFVLVLLMDRLGVSWRS